VLRFDITVAPVVVIPDIDSKKASTSGIPIKIKGIDPAIESTTQKNVIIINPSF
jgi:hypothetical protein